jgi:hypothetical protein
MTSASSDRFGTSSRLSEELRQFEAGWVDEATFSHAEHVRLGFEMLRRFSFEESLVRYATGLQRLAARLGRPERYHTTITVASLALIADRRTTPNPGDWPSFIARCPELLDRRLLERWYPPDLLWSDRARRSFVLPPAAPPP